MTRLEPESRLYNKVFRSLLSSILGSLFSDAKSDKLITLQSGKLYPQLQVNAQTSERSL